MSNAVTSLSAVAASEIVVATGPTTTLGSPDIDNNNNKLPIKLESNDSNQIDNSSIIKQENKLSNNTSPASSSNSDTSSSSMSIGSNSMSSSSSTSSTTKSNINGAASTVNIQQQQQPTHHLTATTPHHVHHLNNYHSYHHLNQSHQQPLSALGGGIQYIQYSNPNSVNGSPSISSSLTSSPSTTNSYHPHFNPHTHHHHHTPPAALAGLSPTSLITTQHHPHPHQPTFHPHSHHHHHHHQPPQQFHAFHPNYKDTRWLTLEVCREYQRNKCNRSENECKFAHPPSHVEILNGKVIACYDSLKGKCTRKEPPCKYLHPPQHLKDQLLQNGKNNLVLRQVALAMMQQQHQQQQTSQLNANTAALLASGVATNGTYATFGASPVSGSANSNTGANQTTATAQLIANNGAIATYSPVQLTNANGTLLPMIANGFHSQNLHMQQAAIYDPSTAALLHQAVSPSTAGTTQPNTNPNGLLPPQQRTDRLQQSNDLNDATQSVNANGAAGSTTTAAITLDNGQTYQIPQFQIYTPIYQRAPNAQQNNMILNQANGASEEINQQGDINKAASTAVNSAANVVDVVQSKKRQHDSIEQEYIPLTATNIYQAATAAAIPVKRAALTDSKTGMPVFQSFNHLNHLNHHQQAIHPQYNPQAQHLTLTAVAQNPATAAAATLNYPTINLAAMQYAAYPTTFSLPYTGHPTGVPRM